MAGEVDEDVIAFADGRIVPKVSVQCIEDVGASRDDGVWKSGAVNEKLDILHRNAEVFMKGLVYEVGVCNSALERSLTVAVDTNDDREVV